MRRVVPAVFTLTLATSLGACASPPAPPRPVDPVVRVEAGRGLVMEGRLDEGEARYREALAADPDHFDALLSLGIVLDLKAQYGEARQHLQRAIDVAPEDRRRQALVTMAISYAFERDIDGALTFYQPVFDAQVAAGDMTGAGASANAIGRIFLEAGEGRLARDWYERGFALSRQQTNQAEADLLLWDLRWLHAEARIAARLGDIDEARRHVAAFETMMRRRGRLDEDLAIYQYLKGYVGLYAGDYAVAIEELSKGNLEDPFITDLLGRAYEGAGDLARAREFYQLTLTRNGHSIQNAFARPHAAARLAVLP
ncbi:MAG: tetratricopeptide repeat protein [Vicinamibacteria bacterium]